MIGWEDIYSKLRMYRTPVGTSYKYVGVAKYCGRVYVDDMVISQETIETDSIDDEGFVNEFVKENLARSILKQIKEAQDVPNIQV